MKILAFEFSSPQRSVAVLHVDASGKPLASSEVVESTHDKTMRPLAMAEAALHQAGLEREQIELIAIGIGPGSYTGIRAGIALAQGWQLGRQVRLVGISSAECIAAKAQAEGVRGNVSVVIDAQRGEFYLADYELTESSFRETTPLRLTSREEVLARKNISNLLIGPEVLRWFPEGRLVFPDAATTALLATHRKDFVDGEKLEPIYLRETTFVKASPPRVIPLA